VVAVFDPRDHEDQLVLDAHRFEYAVVVVERMDALGSGPERALDVAAKLMRIGVNVVSVAEPWVEQIGSGLADLWTWWRDARATQRSANLRRALARAAAEGRTPGRPRRQIDADLARALLGKMPLARAAAELGVGASTLRRWARQNAGVARPAHLSVA
jgi:DNA invertase Pin-like site-specific DNA recombinase